MLAQAISFISQLAPRELIAALEGMMIWPRNFCLGSHASQGAGTLQAAVNPLGLHRDLAHPATDLAPLAMMAIMLCSPGAEAHAGPCRDVVITCTCCPYRSVSLTQRTNSTHRQHCRGSKLASKDIAIFFLQKHTAYIHTLTHVRCHTTPHTTYSTHTRALKRMHAYMY